MDSRRDFLKKAALATLVSGLAPQLSVAHSENTKAKRSLRIAHITDVHLFDKPLAETCFARVLREINSMKDRPELIINTGDTLMDHNKQTRETVDTRWKTWNKIVSSDNKIPILSCLGNHDVWYGPTSQLDEEYKKDKRYGKQWSINELKMPNRFYAVEKNGWKLIALDSINGEKGYSLDEEQFNWLENELKNSPTTQPVLIYSHVPLVSACATMCIIEREDATSAKFPLDLQHIDTKKIKNLFYKHQGVKLCLSGHVHYIEMADYLGVKYLCNGAVSGNWWGEPLSRDEFPPVYTIIDLFADGSISYQSIYYKTNL
jgi:3',5'-cyclic-AMP phosphodiesterase